MSLIGPSGCGKSTLLRIIGDLIQPTSGTVVVNGKPARQARIDRDYGIVFQDPVLYDWRTVAKNVALPLEMARWPRQKRAERVKEMLELVELERLREPPAVAAVGRHAAARLDRARALVRPGAAADGRAVRRARRDDARAAQHGAAADLGGERLDGRVRHALDRRGGLPLDARRRDVAAAGSDLRDDPDRPAAAAHGDDARGAALLRAGHGGARGAPSRPRPGARGERPSEATA